MANIRSSISTIVTYALTGQTEFTVPFEYLTRKFVMVTLLGSDRKVLVLGTDYRFVNKMTISLSSAPSSAYTHIEIRRVTSATDRLVDFRDGSILLANDMNISQLQTLHVADEARDAVTVGGLGAADDGNLDARGRKILRLADGADDNDAVNVKTARKIAQSIGATGTLREDLKSSAGAGEVGTTSGKTVQQELTSGGIVRGDVGNFVMAGCAVRKDLSIGPDWAPVSDSAHIPINVTAVTGGVDIKVEYKGNKIGSFVAGPDESFARDGTLVGASVAANFANVSIGTPCSFAVDLETGVFEFDTKYFDNERFGLSIGGSGNVTLTHPGIRTMRDPIIRYVATGSTQKHLDVHFQQRQTAGVTSCFLVGDVEGTISYNGSNWVLGSCDHWDTSDLEFIWDSGRGELTVKHPLLNGSPELNLTQMYNGTPLSIAGGANAGNSFKVYFHKLDGTPAGESPGLGIYFSRGRSVIRKQPKGKLLVHLGHVQVNCNHVNYPGGNFWFHALMHDTTKQ